MCIMRPSALSSRLTRHLGPARYHLNSAKGKVTIASIALSRPHSMWLGKPMPLTPSGGQIFFFFFFFLPREEVFGKMNLTEIGIHDGWERRRVCSGLWRCTAPGSRVHVTGSMRS